MKNKKESVALSSVFASLAMTFGKAIVGILTGSMGILSEALHSLLDLVAAAMTYFAVRIGDKPADECHNYGHGKVESVSALVETGLLFVTSVWIIYEAVQKLFFEKSEVDATWYSFLVIIISILIDVSRSRALYKVAKETGSQALEADALHFSSDIWSSGVVLLGLLLVRFFGINGADAIAAIVVAVFVSLAGYRLGKRTLDTLLDSAPDGVSEEVKKIVLSVPGVFDVTRVRVRPLGPTIFIDLIINVSRTLPLTLVHKISAEVESKIKNKIPGSDVLVHVKPVQLSNETIIEAVQTLALKAGFSVHDIVIDKLDEKKFISYDLEVPASFDVDKAHKASEKLENELYAEFYDNVVINTHIEPRHEDAILSAKVSEADVLAVKDAIFSVDKEIKEVKKVHDILVRKIDGGFFVSFHCYAVKSASIDKVHTATSRFEYLIRQKMSSIKRVVIHVEPL